MMCFFQVTQVMSSQSGHGKQNDVFLRRYSGHVLPQQPWLIMASHVLRILDGKLMLHDWFSLLAGEHISSLQVFCCAAATVQNQTLLLA